MSYVHKTDHKKVITDKEYLKLLFREKLDYRYTADGSPNLGSSTEKAHIPVRPDPSSYIEPVQDEFPLPNPIIPNILDPDKLDKNT